MSEIIFTEANLPNRDFVPSVPRYKHYSEIRVLAEPIDKIRIIGSYANFFAIPEANNPKYQWYDKYGKQMPRECKNNLTIGPIKEEDFSFYRLEIRDESIGQRVLTRWAELKKAHSTEYLSQQECHYIQPQPKLLMQPEGGAYSRGSRITLTAHFENATHYQWCKDGVKLEGCVGNALIINNANLGNTGDYDLYASNYFGDSYAETRVEIY